MLQIAKISVVVLLLLLAGCSTWQLHGPAASIEKNPSKHGQWQLRCEAAQAKIHNHKTSGQKAKWLWAVDDSNNEVPLPGYLEDGFFVITKNEPEFALTSLQQACANTLANTSNKKNQSLKLVRIRAARSKEKINVPILFPKIHEEKISRIIIFGDSLSDTGKLKQRLGIFPGTPYWLGRFSNGPVWVDYLEAATTMPIQNHSYGGAFTLQHEPVPEENIIDKIRAGAQLFISGSVQLQVHDYIERSLGEKALQNSEQTLFIIWAGANDYIFKEPLSGVIDTFLNLPEGVSGYKKIVDTTINSLKNNILDLHKAGAKKFLLPTLPDIGKSPIALQNKTYMSLKKQDYDTAHKIELSKRLTELTHYHNQKLVEMVNELNKSLNNIHLVISDTNKNIEHIFSPTVPNKKSVRKQTFDYGFSLEENQQTLVSNAKEITLQKRCYTGGYLGSHNEENICKNQKTAFFWDVAHPTTYTHCWQAYMLMKDMSKQGWLKTLPNKKTYKPWCLAVFENNQSAQTGHYIFQK